MAAKELDATWLGLLGLRGDGRKVSEHRRLGVACGVARSRYVDGSCELTMGLTRVVAHVAGPREAPRRSDEVHDRGTLEVTAAVAPFAAVGERSGGSRDRASRELAAHVARALAGAVVLERYPRSRVDVHVHVLCDDGGAASCAVNAASLALVDAGVFLRDVAAGATVAVHQKRLVWDPTRDEQRGASSLDVAVLPQFGTVLSAHLDGEALPQDELGALTDAAVAAACEVGDVLAEEVRAGVAHAVDCLEASAAASRPAPEDAPALS